MGKNEMWSINQENGDTVRHLPAPLTNYGQSVSSIEKAYQNYRSNVKYATTVQDNTVFAMEIISNQIIE